MKKLMKMLIKIVTVRKVVTLKINNLLVNYILGISQKPAKVVFMNYILKINMNKKNQK